MGKWELKYQQKLLEKQIAAQETRENAAMAAKLAQLQAQAKEGDQPSTVFTQNKINRQTEHLKSTDLPTRNKNYFNTAY